MNCEHPECLLKQFYALARCTFTGLLLRVNQTIRFRAVQMADPTPAWASALREQIMFFFFFTSASDKITPSNVMFKLAQLAFKYF